MADPGDVELVKPRSAPVVHRNGLIGRLDRLATTISGLEAALGDLRQRAVNPSGSRVAMEKMASMLQSGLAPESVDSGQSIAVASARADLVQALAGLALSPPPVHPTVSMIVVGGSTLAAIGTLRALGPVLAPLGAEVFLAVDEGDRRASLLGVLLRNLRVIEDGRGVVAACNACVAVSHGDIVMLLAPGTPSVQAMAVSSMMALLRPDRVLVGRAVTDTLARWGVGLGTIRPGPGGLLLALPRALWNAAGGMDTKADDGGGLAYADLCLKLRRLGARMTALDGGRIADLSSACPDRSLLAARYFRERWGDLSLLPGTCA